MKILYVILTCEKYFNERSKNIDETWAKKISPESSIVYVSALSGPKENKIGYNTPDNYESSPLKYMGFIKNYDYSGYDWIFFLDDDIYVFPKRIEKLLSEYGTTNHHKYGMVTQNFGVGEMLDANNQYWNSKPNLIYPVPFLCGGGGMMLTKVATQKIKEWMFSVDDIPWSYNSDVSLGHWLRETKAILINRKDMFGSQHYNHESFEPLDINHRVTYHYCKYDDFKYLDSLE